MKSRKQSSSAGGGGSKSNTSSSMSLDLDGGERERGGGFGCSSKMERKDVEKNRRLHMKGLCLKLSSLMPASTTAHHHHQRRLHRYSNSDDSSPPSTCNAKAQEANTQLDHLEKAAEYIKQLTARIDGLKQRKHNHQSPSSEKKKNSEALPVIEVRYQEGTLDVALVTGSGKPFRMHEVIGVVEEEGAEVVNASFSVAGDKIFYTLHCQALCSRVGLDAARISHRLRNLHHQAASAASAAAAAHHQHQDQDQDQLLLC